jgi:hypothetical protein
LFSKDNRFLVKTLKPTEKELLFEKLDDMVAHISSGSNKSILARIYGVFTLKTNVFSPVDFILMQNTAKLANQVNPKMTFDLKGSSISRYVHLPKEEATFWKKLLD